MKFLTPKEAKELALEIAPQINPVDQREFFLIHSEKVGQVAMMIAQKIGIDDTLFEIAGWVHDIGYTKDFEHHAKYSLSMLEEF
jgi:putative nucleotidyltransferase with HDIG domain